MKSIFIAVLCSVVLAGCGAVDRFTSSMTGGGTETCVDGVKYLQFTSGATVKYNRDGSIATCNI